MKKTLGLFTALIALCFSHTVLADTSITTAPTITNPTATKTTQPDPMATNPTTTDLTATTPKAPPNYTIAISAPADQDTLTTTADSLNVSVTVTPDLEADDTVTLYVDGTASGDPAHGTSLSAPALVRGSHTLQAKITQTNGAGAESQTITVYQQLHNLNSPIQPRRPL